MRPACILHACADAVAVGVQALKLWLFDMRPEPLLTFKLVPALTSPETPRESLQVVLSELPLANRFALFMLLDTCNRIAGALHACCVPPVAMLLACHSGRSSYIRVLSEYALSEDTVCAALEERTHTALC